MTATPGTSAGAPYWSFRGLMQGIRLSSTAMIALALFGAAFGAVAAQKGLTLLHATVMSAAMFAGVSQFVAVEIWTEPLTAATIATLALVTAIVNMRFVLMSAAMHPWFGSLPGWQTYPALALLVEPAWLISMRYREEGGADAGVYVGAAFAMWLVWIVATVPGYLLGALVSDPKPFGLDLVMPSFFVAMLVPMWRGPRMAVAWAVAGATALLVAEHVEGWWFMMAGAVAGTVVGGLIGDRD
jgi:predicted branched-subunit amino acid permease